MKVFISYRRSDDHGGVGRLFDALEARYGQGEVFVDVDSNMPLAVDFRTYITAQVENANVVLAIIGPNWVRLIQEKATDPKDFVRLEIEAAFRSGIPVVPVLMGGKVPADEELPPSIAQLSFLNGMIVDTGADFRHHAAKLCGKLDAGIRPVGIPPAPEPADPPAAQTIPLAPPVPPAPVVPEPRKVETGPHGIEMVWCPSGKFLIGSPPEEAGWNDNETLHEVTLTKGFWIGKYPVTQKQWEAVMGSNPSGFKYPQNPVEQVSWHDAQQFIAKIGGGFRLPTEAEWEYACRAGSTGAWSFGDDESALGNYAWFKGNSDKKTHPVGQTKPNAWGIHDMHGNVWEWCQDLYAEYPAGPATDPKGPPSGTERVFRGGSWFFPAAFCRSALRLRYAPAFRNDSIGFRVAAIPAPPSPGRN